MMIDDAFRRQWCTRGRWWWLPWLPLRSSSSPSPSLPSRSSLTNPNSSHFIFPVFFWHFSYIIYMTSHLLHVKMWTVFRPRLISQCAAGSSSASSLSSSSLDSSWQSSPSWESTLSFSTLSTAASGSSSSQSISSMILRCAVFLCLGLTGEGAK